MSLAVPSSAQPSISVMMPVYNTPATYLREAVSSVLTQDFPASHLIIVDDGSTRRETRAVLDELASGSYTVDDAGLTLAAASLPTQVIVHRQKNAGVSAARNAALDMLIRLGGGMSSRLMRTITSCRTH